MTWATKTANHKFEPAHTSIWIYPYIHRITLQGNKKSVEDRQPRTAFEMLRFMGTYFFSTLLVWTRFPMRNKKKKEAVSMMRHSITETRSSSRHMGVCGYCFQINDFPSRWGRWWWLWWQQIWWWWRIWWALTILVWAGPASYADVEGRPSEYGEVATISDIIFRKTLFLYQLSTAEDNRYIFFWFNCSFFKIQIPYIIFLHSGIS